MTDKELQSLTIVHAAEAIRMGSLSSVELTEAVLRRIEARNARMCALITVTAERAMADARRRDEDVARGRATGPLHGVPLCLKDLIDTAGIRTTAASRVFEGRLPVTDAEVVRRLDAAGMVLAGKANLHEMAFGVTSSASHFGAVRNPWDDRRVAGGSSGGSAAAVALGMALGSLGSDTGGSIRIPAALCGVVGLKPTYGRVSTRGVIPLSWSLDHLGPLTRTVEDAATLLGTIAGWDASDPYSSRHPVDDYPARMKQSIRGRRLGVPVSYFFERIDPEVRQAVNSAISRMVEFGMQLVEVDLPSAHLQRAVFTQIATPEAYAYHEPHLKNAGQLYGADVRNRIESGRLMLSSDYVRAQRVREVMRNECRAAFEKADILITPAVPVTAPLIGQTVVDAEGEEGIGPALTRFTREFNLTGLPAISVPCWMSMDSLPIAFQLAGRPFDEGLLLAAAWHYEQAVGGFPLPA